MPTECLKAFFGQLFLRCKQIFEKPGQKLQFKQYAYNKIYV